MGRRLVENFRRYFLRGLLAFLPLAVTIWILDAVVRVMERGLYFLPRWLRPDHYLPFYVPGIGAIFTVILILAIGVFLTHFVSHRIRDLWDRTVQRIPVVRGIYGAAVQLAEAVFRRDSSNFRRVVLIEYPRNGVFALGLVTGSTEGEVQERLEGAMVNVFVPTAPNPTSGWYIVLPERETIALDMTVEQAFKLIISAGIVGQERAPAEPPQQVGNRTTA
jgi:uncharacterized membrane protein